MTNHISNVCRCSHFHIRILRHIRRTLTNNMANYRRYMILLSTQVVYFKSGLSNILSHTASQKFKCYHHWLMPITCHFRDCKSAAGHESDSCKWRYSKCPWPLPLPLWIAPTCYVSLDILLFSVQYQFLGLEFFIGVVRLKKLRIKPSQ